MCSSPTSIRWSSSISLVEPDLKPHLIDRYLASAEQGGIAPILCLNKADLVEPGRVTNRSSACTASWACRPS